MSARLDVELYGGPGDGRRVPMPDRRPLPSYLDYEGERYWLWVETQTTRVSYRITGWRGHREARRR